MKEMPRRQLRSPNDRTSNRRPNFDSPPRRHGAQMSRPVARFSRSPHRSGSPTRQHRPPQQRIRSQRAPMGPDRPRTVMTGDSFARGPRPPMKRSGSPLPTRHRSSVSPLTKKVMIEKSPPTKSSVLARSGREKRISVSPSIKRRKRTPPRMETAVHRDSSRLTSSLGHGKRDFGSPPRIREHLSRMPVAMKKEIRNDDKPEVRRPKINKSYRLDTNRSELGTFQVTDKIGPGGDVISTERHFRNEFASIAEREHSPLSRDRRDIERFQSSNLDSMRAVEDTVFKNRSMRVENELMDVRLDRGDERMGPYDPEELKKITVDIRRNIPRDGDIIIRRITNPEEVVLVRRSDEGARPIFDRDEIKQGVLEREEEFREKRVVAIVRERGRSRSPIQTMDEQSEMHENFKVHRVSNYSSEAFQSRPSLSDRWQHDRKSGNSGNEKLLVSVRPGAGSPQMIHKLATYRSHAVDDELYRDIHGRDRTMSCHEDNTMLRLSSHDSDERHRESFDSRRPVPINPHDLRHSLISRGRPVDVQDARQKILERQEREPVHVYVRKERSGSLDRMRTSSSAWDRERGRDNARGEKVEGLPNFAARRDRYQYKEWIDKPDVVPKGPSYFEHDTRGEGSHEFRRGVSRGLSRGTSFRSRGGFRARGRSSFVPNYVTRRFVDRSRTNQVGGLGKRSPHQWEHDMFETADMKMEMDEDIRPM